MFLSLRSSPQDGGDDSVPGVGFALKIISFFIILSINEQIVEWFVKTHNLTGGKNKQDI